MTSAISATNLNAAKSAPSKGEADQLREVAKQFEAVFLRQLIGSMRSASLGDDLLGSSSTDQFRDMQDSKLADSMAEKGVLGVADLLVRQFAARVKPADDAAVKGSEATMK